MTITGLAPGDTRAVDVDVAGVAALFVAKAHKITDRSAGPARRLNDKDAGDVLRLVRFTRPGEVAATLAQLRAHPIAGAATTEAIEQLRALFGTQRSPGVEMAVRAMATALPAATVRAQLSGYITQLLAGLA